MGLVSPDPYAFEDFDGNLRVAMQREMELFLDSQVREDHGIHELLTSDYTFVNQELAEELYHAKCRFHGVPPGYDGRVGPELVKDLCHAYQDAFPNQRYEVEQMVAEGDTVAVRWRVSGTHQSPLELGPMSILTTGRKVDVRGFTMCRVQNGQIVEVWQVADMWTAFQQMGADPLTPEP